MTNSIYLIGNQDDIKEYKSNPEDITLLPVKNLPMVYFPFFYSSSESSIEKMKRLLPLFEGGGGETSRDKSVQHTIDTDKLFASLAVLEEKYQPYNNNNTFHITTFVLISYIIMSFIILKIVNYFFTGSYIYIITGMIGIMLIISLTWALVVAGKSF